VIFTGLLLVAGIVLAALPRAPLRWVVGVTMGCMAAAMVGGLIAGWEEITRLRAMQTEFPVVSLASRLAYERRGVAPLVAPALSAGVESALSQLEKDCDVRNAREWQLKRIHAREYEQFIRAAGFGVGRMRQPRLWAMRLAPLRDIAFDEPPAGGEFLAEETGWWGIRNAGLANGAEHLHAVSRADFLDPAGFGASIAPLVKVAGFVEHGLHYSPLAQLSNRKAWTIERLELVSLLKFDEPRVYVLDHLPRMDELSSENAPTRALDAFEKGALGRLWTEEDVAIAGEGGRTRMMGSLRAGSQCLDCHSVPRGTLLGAFSYVLRRGERGEEVAWERKFAGE
jgi:hypothetical protein